MGVDEAEIGFKCRGPPTSRNGVDVDLLVDVDNSIAKTDCRAILTEEGDVVVGSRTKVKIVKNKVAAPFRDAEFDILYGEGISREGDTLDLAVLHNIVDKSGAWYSFQGERIGQGRENVRGFLKENREVFGRIDTELRKKLGIGAASATVPPIPEDGVEVAAAVVKGKK